MSLQSFLVFAAVGMLLAAMLLVSLTPGVRGVLGLGGLGLLLFAWYVASNSDEVVFLRRGLRGRDEDEPR